MVSRRTLSAAQLRELARQEAVALRLLYQAHGRIVKVAPLRFDEDGRDIPVGNCDEGNWANLGKHRRNNEPACVVCVAFRRKVHRARRNGSEQTQT